MEVEEIYSTLVARIAELERKLDSMVTRGPVAQVDPAKQMVRLRLNGPDESEPFLGPWQPYGQIAGALKVHTPPSIGQQMLSINGAGDYRQGVALPYTWSDANPSPSSAGNEHWATFGGATVRWTGASLTVTKGSVTVSITGSEVDITGDVKITGKFQVTGDTFTHNGHDVGSTHTHTQVVHGGDLSGPPP